MFDKDRKCQWPGCGEKAELYLKGRPEGDHLCARHAVQEMIPVETMSEPVDLNDFYDVYPIDGGYVNGDQNMDCLIGVRDGWYASPTDGTLGSKKNWWTTEYLFGPFETHEEAVAACLADYNKIRN